MSEPNATKIEMIPIETEDLSDVSEGEMMAVLLLNDGSNACSPGLNASDCGRAEACFTVERATGMK